MGQQLALSHHAADEKQMTLGDLKAVVHRAELAGMSDASTVHTGATRWNGGIKYIELREPRRENPFK